ncbi:lactonase family protein [Paenibacillus sp.]|uniref:lactonase family protein n=1 Tax=Paenibacillus sp. TaxID=58172 RepID=UPI0028112B8A|nr:lactonase family protein [Paenibacillus sp.]
MKDIFFIGSYANADSSGVYVCEFDRATGEIALLGSYAGLQNPTFLAVHEPSRKLYAITELAGEDGAKRGAVAAFDIDAGFGLSLLNIAETIPAPTCHVELDRTRTALMVSSYHGGMVGMNRIETDGGVGLSTDVRRHEGASVHPAQDRPRAHSVTVDRNNRFAVACDLGADKIVTYRLDLPAGAMEPVSSVSLAPGAGPRHFAFHPTLPVGYVINELNATITAFAYDESSGALEEFQTVPTLPASYEGENACADIHVSPDGRFLYGSNRGHDSVAVFRVENGGALSLVEHASVSGRHPRNFALSPDPDAAYLFAANRDTNDVVVFRRSVVTGRLSEPVSRFSVAKPVCIKFLS